MKSTKTTRRDACFTAGKRALRLAKHQASVAWFTLSGLIADELSALDVPKWADLFNAFREATTIAYNAPAAIPALSPQKGKQSTHSPGSATKRPILIDLITRQTDTTNLR